MHSNKISKISLQIILISVLFSLFLPTLTSATTYYVSPTGNDSNNGLTPATAWRTIGKANSAHQGGDTVYIMPGEYRESLFPKRGSSDQYTVYSGYGNREQVKILGSDEVTGWTPYSGNVYYASFSTPVIRCQSTPDTDCWEDRQNWYKPVSSIPAVNGPGKMYYDHSASRVYVWTFDGQPPSSHQHMECSKRMVAPWTQYDAAFYPPGYQRPSYLTIQNLTIMHSALDGIRMNGGVNNVNILNNEFAFNSGQGSCMENPSAIIHGKDCDSMGCLRTINVIGNKIHDQGSDKGPGLLNPGDHGGTGVKFYEVGNSIIANNEIYNTSDGITIKNLNRNITIRNNTIYNFPGDGITFLVNAYECVAEENIIINGEGKAFYIGAPNPGPLIIRHNTIWNNYIGVNSWSEYGNGVNVATLKNNIFADVGTEISLEDSYGYHVDINDSNFNLFYDSFGSPLFYRAANGDMSFTQWKTNTGNDMNSSVANPNFVNTPYDFHLQSGSPAIDVGVIIAGYHCASAGPNSSGCKEWYGSAPDIGAFEYTQDVHEEGVWYVNNQNPNCNDSGPGTITTPLCTINASNYRHQGGDTVYIMPGEYRESIFPKGGTPSQYTVYSGYGDREQVKILGSDEVTGWTQYSGNVSWASFSTPVIRCQSNPDTDCWEDRQNWYKPVSSISAVNGSGKMYYDHSNSRVYVWTFDGQSPSNHKIECSKRMTAPWTEYDTAYQPSWFNCRNVNNITIQNLTIMHSAIHGIHLDGTSYNINISNNEFAFNSGAGTCGNNPGAIMKEKDSKHCAPGFEPENLLCKQPNINVIGNKIHDQGCDAGPYFASGGAWGHKGCGVKFYDVKDSIVANNEVYNVEVGIELKAKIDNVTIRNNNIYNFTNSGVHLLRHVFNSTIKENIIYGGNGAGVDVGGPTGNISVLHNTVWDVSGGVGIWAEYGDSINTATIKNNIIANADYDMISVVDNPGDGFFAELNDSNYNLFYEAVGNPTFSVNYNSLTLVQWQTQTGNDLNSINDIDPLVIDSSNYDFHLQAGSPAIDNGTIIPGYHCALSDDNGGASLTACRHWSGSAPDIGAFEYTGNYTSSCDSDGDNYNSTSCGGNDCNDNNASIHPGATELCNGVDDDCDTQIDEGFTDTDNDGIKDCVDPDDDNDNCLDGQDYNPTSYCLRNSCNSLINGCGNTCAPITCSGIDSSCGCSAGACTICGSGSGSNAALGSIPDVDSTYPESYYLPEKITDGIITPSDYQNSCWASDESTTNPHWIIVNFTENKNINNVTIYWVWNTAPTPDCWMTPRDLYIQYWNGSAYLNTSIISNPDGFGESVTSRAFPEISTNSIRIFQPALRGPTCYPTVIWLTELQIFNKSGNYHCINNTCQLITDNVYIHSTYQQTNNSVVTNGTNITIKMQMDYSGSGNTNVNIPIPTEWVSDASNWKINESGVLKTPTIISNNLTWQANLSSTNNYLIFETTPPYLQNEQPETENSTHYNNSFTVKSNHHFINVSLQLPINPVYNSWPLSYWVLNWYNSNTNMWESKKQEFNLQIHTNYITFSGFNTSDQFFILSGSNTTCLPDWVCTGWSQCSGGTQSCLSWTDNNNCNTQYTGSNTRSCSTPPPGPGLGPPPGPSPPQPNCTGNQTKSCGSNVGLCKAGTRTCVNGIWGNCTGGTGPENEICNGIDDDCNGLTDDGITCQCNNSQTKSCGSNIGICKPGMMTCINGMWSECIGTTNPNDQEICSNSLDDNCNGETDESDCLSIGTDIQSCGDGEIPLKGCICNSNVYTSGYCCKNTHQLNPCEQTKIPYVEIFLAGIALLIIALFLYSRKQEVISKVKGTPIEMDKQTHANSTTLRIKNKTDRVLRNITVYDSISKGDFLDSPTPPSIETFIDIDNLKWKFSELNPNQELVINYTTRKPQDLKYSKSFVVWVEGKEYRFSK